MRNRFGEQLERLHVEMIQMGALCEDAISAAAQALMKGDEDLARAAGEAEAGDRPGRSREVENPLPEAAAAAAARGTGPAGDLLCAEDDFRSGTDRGPGGGHRGADPVRASAGRPPGRQRIEEMSKAVIRMVTDSVDSFVKRDLELAPGRSAREDDQVDDLFNQVKKELIGLIAADADSGELWLDLIMVAKYLERIGDHATNVAEWVEYSITGNHPSNN